MTPLGLESIKGPRLEVFERTDSEWDFRLVASNGELVCSSLQGFTSESDAERAALRAQELFAMVTEVRKA
jgi:uncharacterized protein YegP (UPF0339 family)